MLGVSTLFTRYTNGSQKALAIVSTSVAFTVFLVLVLYHTLHSCGGRLSKIRRRTQALSRHQHFQLVPLEGNQEDHHLDNNPLFELGDVQNDNNDTDPDRYITPPIIRSAVPNDQLREPALDDLIPVRPEDYAQCGIAQAPQQPVRQMVTYAEVEIGGKKLN